MMVQKLNQLVIDLRTRFYAALETIGGLCETFLNTKDKQAMEVISESERQAEQGETVDLW